MPVTPPFRGLRFGARTWLVTSQPWSSGLALFDPVRGPLACDMVSVSKDAFDGVRLITILASNYALTGEKDLALEQLQTVSKIPCGSTYGALRLDPEWDHCGGRSRKLRKAPSNAES